MRADFEEMLFRIAEQAHGDPALERRVVAAIRVAMRAVAVEKLFGGEALYRALHDTTIRWARWRAPRLARALAINPADARDLGRIQDWEDELFGITGTWTEHGPSCAVKRETSCPFADLGRQDPRICTELVHALETETFVALNPTYRLVPLTRLLSKGDAHCEFRHELRPAKEMNLGREA